MAKGSKTKSNIKTQSFEAVMSEDMTHAQWEKFNKWFADQNEAAPESAKRRLMNINGKAGIPVDIYELYLLSEDGK